jgi:hypothetical protein
MYQSVDVFESSSVGIHRTVRVRSVRVWRATGSVSCQEGVVSRECEPGACETNGVEDVVPS